MATERQRQAVLGVLVVVLAVVLYRAWNQEPSGTPASPSNATARGSGSARAGTPLTTAPDVRLRDLDTKRPKPERSDRNLFRFRTRAAPRPSIPGPPTPATRPNPGVPTGLPPTPPIPLKFIGIVEAPAQSRRIAALVDSMGHAYRGGEGDIVAGQYRILKIGVESIEISHLDGRGRQTIRLSGS